MSVTDSASSHGSSKSSLSTSDSESENDTGSRSVCSSSSLSSDVTYLEPISDVDNVDLHIVRQSMSGQDQEDIEEFNFQQQSYRPRETPPAKRRKKSRTVKKLYDRTFRPSASVSGVNRIPQLRQKPRVCYNEKEIEAAMYATADALVDTEKSSSDKELDPASRFITLSNYENFGFYYQHTETVGSHGETERRFYSFIDCVGLQKVLFVSQSGQPTTAIVAWLIEPLQPPCSINMVDSKAQALVRRMLEYPDVKPARTTRKQEVHYTLFDSQKGTSGHLWKIIAPTQKTLNNPNSYKEDSIEIYIEYMPFPVTLEKLCPGGLRYIMKKYSLNEGWFSDKAFKRPFHCFQKITRNKNKIQISSDTLPMLAAITKGEARKFLNYYDYEQFQQDSFDFSTTGRYQLEFLAQHFKDKRMYETWAKSTAMPVLEVNWGTKGTYKSEMQAKFEAGDFDSYVGGDKFLTHRQYLKRNSVKATPTKHFLDKKEAFLRRPKIIDVLFDGTNKTKTILADVKPIVCTWCDNGTVYASASSIETHWNLCHPEKKTNCTQCKNIVSRHWEELGLLQSHKTKRHNIKNEFACAFCTQRFNKYSSCKRHELHCGH